MVSRRLGKALIKALIFVAAALFASLASADAADWTSLVDGGAIASGESRE